MSLAVEVGLGPGDFVFHGDPAIPEKRAHHSPNFWPMSIVAKRLDGPRCHFHCFHGLTTVKPSSLAYTHDDIGATAEGPRQQES